MFEGLTSISLARQIPLSVVWRMWMFVSCTFCIAMSYVGTIILFDPLAFKLLLENGCEEVMESLQPLGNEICHAKLIEVYPSNISCNLLAAKIFNFPAFVEIYYGQRVVTSVL